MEGGDDIGVAGPGIEKVAGASGYDWEIGLGDPVAQDADLALPIAPLGVLQVGVRDKFNEVEALSGWKLDDTLRGDDIVPAARGGAGFIGCDVLDQSGLDRIAGLDPLVRPLNTPLAGVIAQSASQDCPLLSGPNVWGAGNILLGGGGSDLIEGRGADDIIDGDRYLSVRLSVRTNKADPASEIGYAVVTNSAQSAMTTQYLRDATGALTGPTLQQAVFAGSIDPGNIVAVREILSDSTGTDTALFSGPRSNYTITATAATATELAKVTVTQTGANVVGQKASDGTDTLRNIEAIRFSDQTIQVRTPAAPTNVVATASAAATTTGTAAVTWAAPVANGGPALTSYNLLVKSGATTVQTITGIARTALSRTVTGLVNGTSYTFQVQGVNLFGPGALSAESNSVTPAGLPGAPTAVVANRDNASAALSWTQPASDGGSPITGYTVQVRQGTAVIPPGPPVVVTVTGTSATVTGLTNGTAYNFRVQAVNAFGSSALSAASNTVTPATVPNAPVIGVPTQGPAGGGLTAVANWSVPVAPPAPANGGAPITNYRVTALRMAADGITPVGTPTVAIVGATPTSRSFTLAAGNYRFEVVAINNVGNSAPSARSAIVAPR